jgi:signal recognition particle subunit SRP54
MLMGQFTLTDFLSQIKAIKKMGPLQDLVEKLPFLPGGLPGSAQVDDYELVRVESIINSMTPTERRKPDVLNQSRIDRVARGAGRKDSEVRDLLTKFKDMRDLMSAMGGGKIRGRWKGVKGLKQMFGGPAGAPSSDSLYNPSNPFGLPEVKKGKVTSQRALEKQRKKSKLAKKARKKARKR